MSPYGRQARWSEILPLIRAGGCAKATKNEVIPAMKKAVVTSLLARRVELGGSQSVHISITLANFSDLDSPNVLVKGLVPEARNWRPNSIRWGTRSFLYTYMPELSLRLQ